MKLKSNIMAILRVVGVFIISGLIICRVAYAATGDFTMERRVVNGYKVQSYQYSSAVNKTLECNAYYDYSGAPRSYAQLLKHDKLSVSIYQEKTGMFGSKKWKEIDSYDCDYSGGSFSLSESVSLKKGTYGFMMWRAFDDTFMSDRGKVIGYLPIVGNVRFK